MTGMTGVVVGAGLAGAAAAWQLAQHGFAVRVFEQSDVVGGHVRTEWFRGVPYEPHGAHIFHTQDLDVWRLVTKLTAFEPYRHRVTIRMCGQLVSWPLQVSELRLLPAWDEIRTELDALPEVPDTRNFESYCISLLGPRLYGWCVRDYTRKQWGRDPDSLAARMAVNRVELRRDGYRDLFRDPYQGWPTLGYTPLVEALLEFSQVHLGRRITASGLGDVAAAGEPVIITSALDDFFEESAGALEWRGVRLLSELRPDTTLAQPTMVVNEPDSGVAWTRTIETKWARADLHTRPGTIVMREYPGADAKHYPVPDNQGLNQARQCRYERLLATFARNPLYAAGRLATYRYINMDEAIRQGIDAARRVLEAL
ncbi:FAD-dependent oxidoreductase [Salinispora arenicola]|uniref:FAD-dependent oxidoreductase n=1 Tax=Salinispora arenicola TaxID=168697 RepID=UPI00037823AF|nr:FAD-dependent oxidoreductase [Salinispora arenicola]